MFSKSLLLTTAVVLGSLSAQAEILEKVDGRIALFVSDCERSSGGGYDCSETAEPEIEQNITIGLETSGSGGGIPDGNNSGDYEYRVDTVDGARIFVHVFVNKLTHSETPFYLVSLTLYGDSTDRGKEGELFPGMAQTTVRMESLEVSGELSVASPPFQIKGEWKQLRFTFDQLNIRD